MARPIITIEAATMGSPEWPKSLRGKTVVVVGLGRLSGPAAVRVLSGLGARVTVNDARTEDELHPTLNELRSDTTIALPELALGGHPEQLADTADLFVLSPGVPYDLPMLTRARANDIPTIGELELAYRLSAAQFIAITGTKGKSSTATILAHILTLGLAGNVCLAGNIGVPLCEEVRDLAPTDVIVAEVSSFQLESIVDFRPRIAVVLNVSADHLDRHGTMDAYVRAKARITENQRPEDLLVVNVDDPIARSLADSTQARVLGISMERPVDSGAYVKGEALMWRDAAADSLEARAVAMIGDLRVPGAHNHANALAATAVAMGVGVPEDAVRQGIAEFNGLPHALETVVDSDSVRYVDDSKATNLAAVRAALRAFDADAGHLVLIMGGVDKGNDYTELADELVRRVKYLVLLGPHVARLEKAFAGRLPLSRAASMDEAVSLSRNAADAGDMVLLSPGHASFDLFSDWKERGDAFKKAVRAQQ